VLARGVPPRLGGRKNGRCAGCVAHPPGAGPLRSVRTMPNRQPHCIGDATMPHMLLIVEPIGQREARGIEGGKLAYQQMLAFTEDLKRAGALMASSSLATAATTAAAAPGGGDACAGWPVRRGQGNDRWVLPSERGDAGRGAGLGRALPCGGLGHRRGARDRALLPLGGLRAWGCGLAPESDSPGIGSFPKGRAGPVEFGKHPSSCR
jgi:hypothetical protein